MGEKFLQMQHQMHHDNEDMQDYLRDLKNWETEIKRKDEALKQDKSTQDAALPPIRNQGSKKRKQAKRKKQQQHGVGTKETKPEAQAHNGIKSKRDRIKAYDFRSWDKFDVDKACAAVDSDEDDTTGLEAGHDEGVGHDEGEGHDEGADSGMDSEEERELEKQRRIQEACMEKDKGNALFKQGRHKEAVVCYTAGMEADPTNAILPANRAMARLKLQRFDEAEADCDKSISLDCTYVKAYARRAAARVGLGKLEQAKKDYQQVLNLEASNKQAAAEIKRIDTILQEREDAQRRKSDVPCNIVYAIQKPVHMRSKKPLKRMVIEEVGTGSGDDEDTPMTTPLTTPTEKPKDSTTSSCPSQIPTKQNLISELQTEDEPKSQSVQQMENPSSEIRPQVLATMSVSTNPNPVSVITPPSIPAIPSSSYQLQADWRRLERFPQQLFQYLKKIPPQSYKQLLQQSLDSVLLMKILTLLRDEYIRHEEPVFDTLQGLSQVKRFEMNIMFMSSKDQQVLQEIFSFVESSGSVEQLELNNLKKKYGL